MKIIQSFWTGNKNSLTDSYGWLLPIFNYLSWIISGSSDISSDMTVV